MLMLSKKNRKKVIDMIRVEIKENQLLGSINLGNRLIKKLFLEKRKYQYIDLFGDWQIDSYYVFREDVLDIIKYIDFSNFNFSDVIVDDEIKNEIIISDIQKQQLTFSKNLYFNNSTDYMWRITGKRILKK